MARSLLPTLAWHDGVDPKRSTCVASLSITRMARTRANRPPQPQRRANAACDPVQGNDRDQSQVFVKCNALVVPTGWRRRCWRARTMIVVLISSAMVSSKQGKGPKSYSVWFRDCALRDHWPSWSRSGLSTSYDLVWLSRRAVLCSIRAEEQVPTVLLCHCRNCKHRFRQALFTSGLSAARSTRTCGHCSRSCTHGLSCLFADRNWPR